MQIKSKRKDDEIMKNAKKYFSIAVILVLTVIAGIGCNSAAVDNDNTSVDAIGIVLEGIEVSDVVLEAAKSKVEQFFEINCADFPDYKYVNWRIEDLKYNYTYEDLDGMQLVIYQMNYEFLSEAPENIMLVGGMYITEDNWVMTSYPNSTYLIFHQDEDELIFLGSIMANDCTPGTEIFTDDLRRILL